MKRKVKRTALEIYIFCNVLCLLQYHFFDQFNVFLLNKNINSYKSY